MSPVDSDTPVPVQLVVFDLGGVVVRICRSIVEAGRRVGIDVAEEDISPERRAERRAIHHEYELGRMTCDEFFVAISQSTGGKYSPAQFRAMHEHWIIGEYEGVAELIDELHALGVHTGILSNTNASHWAIMHNQSEGQREGQYESQPVRFVAPRMPRHPFASHLLGLAKPDGAIYRVLAERSGFSPESIVFFDDLVANVDAARAERWRAHQIDHTGDTAAQMRRTLRERHGIALG